MKKTDLPNEIRGYAEREIDKLINVSDYFTTRWFPESDVPTTEEAAMGFALGIILAEMQHYMELEYDYDNEEMMKVLDEIAKIVRRRKTEIISALRESEMD